MFFNSQILAAEGIRIAPPEEQKARPMYGGHRASPLPEALSIPDDPSINIEDHSNIPAPPANPQPIQSSSMPTLPPIRGAEPPSVNRDAVVVPQGVTGPAIGVDSQRVDI